MKYTLRLCCLAILLGGCSLNTTKQPENIEWERLVIISEGRVKIAIDNYSDSSTVIIYHRGSFFAPAKKLKIDTLKVSFTKSERDSLAALTQELISNPAKPKGRCTEFVGNLELSLKNGQFTQTGEYESVCDWNKLSDTTMQLHNILKRRIKGVYLGENN